jgi:hypothetical protein
VDSMPLPVGNRVKLGLAWQSTSEILVVEEDAWP